MAKTFDKMALDSNDKWKVEVVINILKPNISILDNCVDLG